MELNNELFDSLRSRIKQHRSGLGYDTTLWLETIQAVDEQVRNDPAVLNPYKRHLETDKGGRAVHTLEDRIKSFRVNPWAFGNEIITKRVMGETSQSHFGGFTPKQKEFLRDLLDPNIPLMIASCNRGGAKTWNAALAVACYQYCMPKRRITILGGSKEQSMYLYEYFQKFILGSDLKYIVNGDVLQSRTRFIHGGEVKAFTASMKSVRGARTDIIIIDECCQAESDIIRAALPQAIVASNIKIVLMSTPDKMFHMFRDIYLDYQKYGFKRYHWDAYECPWIPQKTIKMFQTIYDKNQFRIEFLGLFGSATGTVFDAETIEHAVVDELPDDIKLSAFSNGIDWGFKDPTVSCLAGLDDSNNSWVVSSKQWKEAKEDVLYTELLDRCHENSAESYADASHAFQNRTMQRQCGQYGLGFHMVPFNKFKMQMISNARSRLEHGRVRIYKKGCEELINQLLAYSYMENSDKPQKGNDHHVDAFMLCMWGHRRNIREFQIDDRLEMWDASRILDKSNAPTEYDRVFTQDGLYRRPWLGQV